MRPKTLRPSSSSPTTLLLPLVLLPQLICASGYDCGKIRIDGHQFDLSPLSGPHSIWHVSSHEPSKINTTYTVDICRPLRRTKNVDRKHECPNSTWVCGIERPVADSGDKDGKLPDPTGIIPIAGSFDHEGRSLDAQWKRMKPPKEDSDESPGLRLVLHGGKYPFHERHGRPQRAVIEFLCDKDRTGLEGLVEGAGFDDGAVGKEEEEEERWHSSRDEDKPKDDDDGDNDDDGGGDDDDNKDDGKSLRFISYEPTPMYSAEDTLTLEWRTKYACEDYKPGEGKGEGDKHGSPSSHWGFFTWFIIILFLATATYLIFASWLNYNRYGARGWDLLPHSDTIRDLPYLLKDFVRRVISTVQGGGSRGGYSAV